MEKFIQTSDCIIRYETATKTINVHPSADDDYVPSEKKGKLSDSGDETIKPKDLSSWKTLLAAAKTRKYDPLLHFENEDTAIPEITYHSKCRKFFIMKRDLDALRKLEKNDEAADKRRSVRLQSPPPMQSATILKPNCVFCGKVDRWKDRKRVAVS